ncbi:hypothetical protein E8E14_003208 [Neopestalotiopsis sp. 37M]|nr:hypothetical protein E8E14_003208 [Neopestalotiopsis sp. 37M]
MAATGWNGRAHFFEPRALSQRQAKKGPINALGHRCFHVHQWDTCHHHHHYLIATKKGLAFLELNFCYDSRLLLLHGHGRALPAESWLALQVYLRRWGRIQEDYDP